jgi:hypothetical protein
MARGGFISKGQLKSKGSAGDLGAVVGLGGANLTESGTELKRTRSADRLYKGSPTGGGGGGGGEVLDVSDPPDEELEDDLLVTSCRGLEEAFEDARQAKRPPSRKKDPSASAASGLGALDSPARMSDAFEQRRTRQPIPIESWGPRPPSRAGGGGKSSFLDGAEEPKKAPTRSSSHPCVTSPPAKANAAGGTWATARAAGRSSSETRRPQRDRRHWAGSAAPEVSYSVAELGLGSPDASSPSKMGKSQSSGVLEHYHHQAPRSAGWQQGHHGAQANNPWIGHDGGLGSLGLEVSGFGLGEGASANHGCVASPPTRQRPQQMDGVCVEDVDTDWSPDPGFRQHLPPAQVIVTRSREAAKGKRNPRREGGGDRRSREVPTFHTSLDVDFLSLFAS